MPRLPLLAGSRVAVVNAPDDAVLLRAPPPLDPITEVGTAVREALRYPLSGPPLAALVRGGARVTVVVEPPSLPLPGAPADPRQDALAAILAELERLGVPGRKQMILVAGGLSRRAGQRELEALLRPAQARDFHGTVAVHDCETPSLHLLGERQATPLRVSPHLVDTDLVVVVSAAETVLDGGPAALLQACAPETLRAAGADSLLETRGSPGWDLAVALERLLTQRVPVMGVSLVLDHPRATGRLRGWPHDPEVAEWIARSSARHLLNVLPALTRRRILQGLPRELRATAAFAGPPSVAHAEALLRGIALRGVRLERPLDAVVIPLPWRSSHHPREPLNPLTAATIGLGLVLRLWRDAFPVADGGTAVLVHRFTPTFGHGAGVPYRALFQSLQNGLEQEGLAEAEELAAHDRRAVAAYRAGRAPHPLLPYAEWASCAPALSRLGRVIVAGCRDAGAARRLGFVPSHSTATALEMAYGVAEGRARVGFLLAPPYAPLLVGESGAGPPDV